MQDQGVSDLLVQSAIMRLIHTYPRGLDRLDKELLLSIGHADATVDFPGMFSGSWAGFVDWLMAAHTDMLYNRHTIGNVLIEVDGDKAVSETTATAHLVVKRADGDIENRETHSRYLDSWRLDGGRWWLAGRRTLRDYRSIDIITPERFAATTSYVHAADVGRDDPSYAHFGR
ncbi:nuclear transport factor 2 family protein [Rhizorhabdus wittichii]|uniref:Nuclear transport factor 2 family protein n=1 Tax=Rhizorhabdus wittichii TaxID=160791 RepID=A0A975HDH2_9SPHN|nr:nuclear transport factor 2 family protein [Rhizorhabdus wittichii]